MIRAMILLLVFYQYVADQASFLCLHPGFSDRMASKANNKQRIKPRLSRAWVEQSCGVQYRPARQIQRILMLNQRSVNTVFNSKLFLSVMPS